MNLLTLVNIMK